MVSFYFSFVNIYFPIPFVVCSSQFFLYNNFYRIIFRKRKKKKRTKETKLGKKEDKFWLQKHFQVAQLQRYGGSHYIVVWLSTKAKENKMKYAQVYICTCILYIVLCFTIYNLEKKKKKQIYNKNYFHLLLFIISQQVFKTFINN